MSMLWQFWGATPEEINGPLVGDHVVPAANLVATRSITLAAPPSEVFAWIQQMGFGKGGWYSYDFIDNLGRTSAMRIHHEWQNLQLGDEVPAGPISFYADTVEPPHALVLRLGRKAEESRRVAFSLAYELHEIPDGTRLVTRVRANINLPGGQLIERFLLGPGDGIMMRKQLLNLAKRTG
jgi:uncharacterized protein YndB with AHSA1/START domain